LKLCVVGPAYPFRGGIAHHTTLLCRHLAERGEVNAAVFKRLYPSFLFPGKSQLDPSAKACKFNAIPLIDSLDPRTWIDAGRFVRDLAADLVLIQWWQPFFGPCLASIASRAKIHSKVAFICHNVLPHERMPFGRALTLRALRHGDGFIVHSGRDAKDLSNLRPDLPPHAIRKTIHPQYEIFPISGMTKDEARRRLRIQGRVVLFFGLVRKYKGLMDLIDAMSLVRTPDVICLAVGEFYDDKARYVARIERLDLLNRVRLIDRYIPNEEVEQYFAAADVVVLPYRAATQSGVVQMAFRFERPVIATSVGGLPESIDDGRTGLLVPPGDPKALAHAIDRYFDEALESHFSAAIREDEGRFSWDRVIEAIESLGDSIRA